MFKGTLEMPISRLHLNDWSSHTFFQSSFITILPISFQIQLESQF